MHKKVTVKEKSQTTSRNLPNTYVFYFKPSVKLLLLEEKPDNEKKSSVFQQVAGAP